MKFEETCANCKFWQEWEDRVYARINGTRGKRQHLLELRRCRFKPHPGLDILDYNVYTDQDFSCSEYKPHKSGI